MYYHYILAVAAANLAGMSAARPADAFSHPHHSHVAQPIDSESFIATTTTGTSPSATSLVQAVTTATPTSATVLVEAPVSTATVTTTGVRGTTYTTGPPSTPTVVVERCVDPAGWDWAHYGSNSGFLGGPHFYKTIQPDDSGVTTTIGFEKAGSDKFTFYQSSKTVDGQGFALNQHSYLRATASGRYTFALKRGASKAWFWAGDYAYSGWSETNNASFSYHNAAGYHDAAEYTVYINEGDYFPVRILTANNENGGPSSFEFSVRGPNGQIVPDGDFVQYACAATGSDDGLKFPAFGNEV